MTLLHQQLHKKSKLTNLTKEKTCQSINQNGYQIRKSGLKVNTVAIGTMRLGSN